MSDNLKWIALLILELLQVIYTFTVDRRVRANEKKLNKLFIISASSVELIEKQSQLSSLQVLALKRLTDPEAIMEDMEKGARMREMYDANRTVLPREDAGPPAKVYSPNLRAKVPRGNYKRTEK